MLTLTIRKFFEILDTMKLGFDHYGWIFIILGGGVLVGQFFGLTGSLGTLASFAVFYYLGKGHKHFRKS